MLKQLKSADVFVPSIIFEQSILENDLARNLNDVYFFISDSIIISEVCRYTLLVRGIQNTSGSVGEGLFLLAL